MNTIQIEHTGVKLIAHRGLSTLERENTAAAFVAAGNRSYFGIETDVHVTKDGKFILIHDDTTTRVSGIQMDVEESSFDDLRAIRLLDHDDQRRGDLCLPTPAEYFSICKKYDKTAVFELKNPFSMEKIEEILNLIKETGWLARTIFISFSLENCKKLRKANANIQIQYLYYKDIDQDLIDTLKEFDLSLDVRHDKLNFDTVAMLKEQGIVINCWTVDDPERAAELVAMGVDYITTNRLE